MSSPNGTSTADALGLPASASMLLPALAVWVTRWKRCRRWSACASVSTTADAVMQYTATKSGESAECTAGQSGSWKVPKKDGSASGSAAQCAAGPVG